MNPSEPNSYMKAIQAVGTVVQDYDRYILLLPFTLKKVKIVPYLIHALGHKPSSRLALLSARLVVTFPATDHHRQTQLVTSWS